MGKKVSRNSIADSFTWGPVVQVHTVGPYDLVEYRPQVFERSRGTGRFAKHTHFSVYIGGRDVGVSYKSLQRAMIGVICQQFDGPNERLSSYVGGALNDYAHKYYSDDGDSMGYPKEGEG